MLLTVRDDVEVSVKEVDTRELQSTKALYFNVDGAHRFSVVMGAATSWLAEHEDDMTTVLAISLSSHIYEDEEFTCLTLVVE